MEKRRKILEIRQRLDKTLASPNLTNEESINTLVKSQLLRSPFEGDIENVVKKRSMEVSNFLKMLRSASSNDKEELKAHGESHNDWKIKQDNDQLRVLYREGPQGTPYHTLLAEGCVDGPIDVCLCVSWEVGLYKKWWPQYSIPPFKIINANSLQKVRIGEEISLVRVKVPWPMSDREAVLHYYELEYFEEDLVLILLNTICDKEDVDISTHGYTRNGIPDAKDAIRLDLVGGFVLQKVSSNKSYFRAIANMDIKVDFLPPSLINFISRQLIGNGHKLYQKALASIAIDDDDYNHALEEPMYVRIREGQKSDKNLEIVDEVKSTGHHIEEPPDEASQVTVPMADRSRVSELKK
ncbi:hypothetical protein QJS10_CPA08g00004 [Acorus calamus]|uniref:Uncharacterized protein n=1 Tax=Acorus calamus TaxID=4465 RepID=A0AAV9ECS1_ACOCL|nr:hypothetical protein QJS10_CPA08g00004 [Acorus calamus]